MFFPGTAKRGWKPEVCCGIEKSGASESADGEGGNVIIRRLYQRVADQNTQPDVSSGGSQGATGSKGEETHQVWRHLLFQLSSLSGVTKDVWTRSYWNSRSRWDFSPERTVSCSETKSSFSGRWSRESPGVWSPTNIHSHFRVLRRVRKGRLSWFSN